MRCVLISAIFIVNLSQIIVILLINKLRRSYYV